MLYLAKVLPALVLPSGFVILLLVLSVALKKRALAVGAIAVLWLSSTSLVSDAVMRAAEGWQVRQPASAAPAADAIVVLSGGLKEVPGRPVAEEWAEGVDRFDAGVELAKAGKAPLLVFTGGWLPWNPNARPEGDILREKAVALGVPRDRIAVSGIARNTEEESRAVAVLLRGRNTGGRAPSIVLVTSAYHMRRSALLFTRAGLSVAPFPVDFQTSAAPASFMSLLPHAGAVESMEIAIREFYGYAYYSLIKRH